MAPTLVNSYKTEVTTADATTMTSPSFTPSVGELLVVKAANSDAGQTFGTPAASGFTVGAWTQQVNVGTGGSSARTALWTAQVTASAAGTISVTPAGGTREHSMVIERWSGWQLAATPATVSFVADATSPFTGTITTAQADSVISWVAADWNGVNPTSATLADSPSQEQTATYQSGVYAAFWCTQAAPSAGANTVGISSDTGAPSLTLAGIEVQAAAGGAVFEPNVIVNAPNAAVQRAATW